MTNLIDLTITEALAKLKSGEITSTQLTSAYLDRIAELNPELNAYITVTRDRALADAAASDARYAAGNPLPLDGIPVGIKDNFATNGIRTTAASRMLENFVPEYESTVSQKLIDAGCVCLGKMNMDEFAMSGTGRTSFFGATINPYSGDDKLTPGGSSSGSATAIASGLCMAATGTDTGDSIRVPASFTGIVGMKPSYGVCSRFGCIAYSSSLDHPGPMARNVSDCALMLSAMAGHDPLDSTSTQNADKIAKQLSSPLQPLDLSNLKIGIIREFADAAISPDMKSIFEKRVNDLKSAGAEIIEISIPHIMNTGVLYGVISRAEASSNLARYDGMRYGLRVEGSDLNDTYMKTRAAGFGDNVKFRLMTGAIMLTHDFYEPCFIQATKVRRIIDNEFIAAFEQCDLILTPSATGAAFKLNEDLDATQSTVSAAMLIAANMSGLPACSVPAGQNDTGLPLGIQIMGRRFDDVRVMQFANEIEKIVNLDNRPTTVMGK